MNKLTISEAKRVLVGKQQEDMYTVRLAHLNSVITETESEIARVEEQITESATAIAAAIVEDALVNGVVDKAPSQNAVYDALVTNLNDSKSYSDSVVLGLLDDRGSFTPSGSYPTIGGSGVAGAIMKGDVWYVTGLGSGVTATIGSVEVKDGDTVRALLNTPGQTDANWDVMSSPINAITVQTLVNSRTAQSAPADADNIPITDGASGNAFKRLTWGTVKSLLTTLFNTLYAPLDPRIQTVTSAATVTPTFSNELVIISAQASALALANPTGTAKDGKDLLIRIKDNGTARAITFDTQYRAIGITLPTTTVIGKTMYLGIIYNSTDAKWDILGLNQQA
jgi:hypothetical protein